MVELRVLNTPRQGTVSGYFDDVRKAAHAGANWSGKAPGVYFTLNPLNRALLARANNRMVERAKNASSDDDVICRSSFLVDFDPKRPSGISSTDPEHQFALDRASACRNWLSSMGWPSPVLADSGNGAHLLYAVSLPNDAGAADLLKRCLEAIDFQFTDDTVEVDCTTYNAARICKLYGTMACKGDSTPERPHRLSRILSVPKPFVNVPPDLLEVLARMGPPAEQRQANAHSSNGRPFDLDRWIQDHRLQVISSGPWKGSGFRWVLNPCPWNQDHDNRSAFIVRWPDGTIGAGCHHNSCRGNDWHALRALFEPDSQRDSGHQRSRPESVQDQHHLWPDPPAMEAYYGLAGEIVRALEAQSEADPVALLIQILVAFGNIIGRSAHFLVEGCQHFCILFAILVGETSKARKGTSWGRIRYLLEQVEPEWASKRILGGLSSGEGLIWNVRDPIQAREKIKQKGRITGFQEYEADPGVSDKRLLVYEPEFAIVLRQIERQGNTLSAIIRQAWERGDLRTLTKNSPATATGAHVSKVGHITAEELRRYLSTTEAASGFGNRFLWFCVRRSKVLPEGGNFVDLAPFADRLSNAIAFGRSAGELRRDDNARRIWHEVYPSLSEGKAGLAGALVARAEAQTMRLACVYALLDHSPLIQANHLMAALALWDYCERSVRFIFGDSLGDDVADEILSALRSRDGKGMTRTEIANYFGRHHTAGRIARALGILHRFGLVECRTVGDTGGRPAECWFTCEGTAQKAK